VVPTLSGVFREPLAKDHPELTGSLIERFTDRVMADAQLPPARRADVRDSCELWAGSDPPSVGVTCTITGTEHESPWDGSREVAVAVVDEAAESTAHLVTRTDKYPWLQSRK
jgi:hypothetical protein